MPFERRPHANCKGILASRIAERHGKRIYRGLLHPIPIPFPHSRSSPLLQGSQTASQQQPPVQKNLTKIARDRVWQRGIGASERAEVEGREEGGRKAETDKVVAWMRLSAKSAVWARAARAPSSSGFRPWASSFPWLN